MKKETILYIEWYDAHSSDKWQSVVEAKMNLSEMMLVRTVGYLIRKTRWFVIIAHSLAWSEEWNVQSTTGVLHIPRKTIKEMKEINL